MKIKEIAAAAPQATRDPSTGSNTKRASYHTTNTYSTMESSETGAGRKRERSPSAEATVADGKPGEPVKRHHPENDAGTAAQPQESATNVSSPVETKNEDSWDSETSETQLRNMQERLRLLQSENEAIKSQLDNATRDIKAERDVSEGLRRDLGKAKAKSGERSGNQNMVDKSPRDEDRDGLTDEKDGDHFSSLSDSIEEVQAELKALKEQKLDAESLGKKLENATLKLATSAGELTDAKDQLDASKKTVNVLSNSLEAALAELKELKDAPSNQSLVDELATAKVDLEKLANSAGQLTEAEGQLKASRKTVDLLSNRLEEARNELKSLKGEEKIARSKELSKDLQEAKDALMKVKEDSAKKMTDAEEQLRSSKKTVDLLSNRLEKAFAEIKAMKESSSENQQLKDDLAVARADLDSLKAQQNPESAEGQNRLAEAETALKASKKTVGLLSNSLEEALEELKTLKESTVNKELRDELAEARAEIQALKASSKGRNQSQDDELDDAQNQLASSQRTVAYLRSNLSNAQGELAALQDSSGKALKEAKEQVAQAREDARKSDHQVSLLTSSLRDARHERDLARSQNSSAGASHDDLEVPGGGRPGDRNRDDFDVSTMSSQESDSKPKAGTPTNRLPALPGQAIDPRFNQGEGDPDQIIDEEAELSLELAGRVIGKGGEIIRDLIARSGAEIVVDQSALPGRPRKIRYRGERSKVRFAQSLVDMLASGMTDADLPLGEARKEILVIPSSSTGKVIGRGGDMVREIQNRSNAKIDFAHDSESDLNSDEKRVVVIGSSEAVAMAKEMIIFLTINPNLDANQCLNILAEHKATTGGRWGAGPPYQGLPCNGMNMREEMFRESQSRSHQSASLGSNQTQEGREIVFCKKQYMGRIIGAKGSVIKDLQSRSGTSISINQDVLPGADCEIKITGSAEGIAMVKQLIQQIISSQDSGKNRSMASGSGFSYGVSNPAVSGGSRNQSYNAGNNTFHAEHTNPYSRQPPPPAPPSASEWKSTTAPDGQVYYWNERTGESRWGKPPGMP